MMRQKLLAFILPLAVAGILGFLFHQKMKTEKERTTTTTWEDDGQVTNDDTAGEVQMDEAPTQHTQDGYSPQQQKEEEGEDTTDVIDDRVPSDESLLEDARKLTANPILRLALTQEGILRIFVRFVDNAANGVLDESVKPLLGNYGAFKADVNRDGYLAATQSTTQRFTPLVAALTSIPPKDVATWLRKAEPRLQEILREMGYANTTFQSILTDATANILQIPISLSSLTPRSHYKSYCCIFHYNRRGIYFLPEIAPYSGPANRISLVFYHIPRYFHADNLP